MPTPSLNDSTFFAYKNQGKSPAFFALKPSITISNSLVTELVAHFKKNHRQPVRICLHADSNNALHDMIVILANDQYAIPHKHLHKEESYHVIQGQALFVIFNDDGSLQSTTLLSSESNFIFRVGANLFHTLIPLSDFFIYHEARPGPFNPQNDSIFANWAPASDQRQAGLEFLAKIKKEANA